MTQGCYALFLFFLRCSRAQLPLKKAGWHLCGYAAAKENKISYPFKTRNTISVALFFFYSFIFTPPFSFTPFSVIAKCEQSRSLIRTVIAF